LLPRSKAATFPNRSQSCVFPCDYSEFGIQCKNNTVNFSAELSEGPTPNSELGRKRRQIGGTQFPFPLADGAEITIAFSFFSGPAQSAG
jgi:hypothetical protein